ncbi:hypothetical protein HYZ82_02365 [Candidatus Nomurabacteria bacterium]|nr:hypothetical protein [Candidatus Nomurabacteria bacterium]
MSGPEGSNIKAYNIASSDWYEFRLRQVSHMAESKDLLPVVLEGARTELGVLFTGKEAEFEALLNGLSQRQYKDNDELIKIFARSISEFAKINFSLLELEQRARAPERIRKDQIKLNGILFFNIGRNDPTKIKLHLSPASTLTIGEKLKQFREGLQELAKLLRDDPRFSEVKTIMAKSWIVFKNPEIFKRLGFDILEENEKDKLFEARRATMSREVFENKFLIKK